MVEQEEEPRELFTASEVARFCQVDLKTIHNWCERGEIRHFRTPGRHLRFRRLDVVDFLRKYGYPVPDDALVGRPRVHLLDDDSSMLAGVKRQLSKRMDITVHPDAFDALLALGADQPDALVLDVKLTGIDGLRLLARLRANPQTRHVRAVVFSAHEDLKKRALDAGAAAFVTKPDIGKLKDTLEAILGKDR